MKNYKKKGGKITPQDFNQFKVMQEHGFNPPQIHEILGWGEAVIRNCLKYDTMEDYQAFLDEKYSKSRGALNELTPSAQAELDNALEDWKIAFDSHLQRIDTNLDQIKDMINQISKKKRGFWE